MFRPGKDLVHVAGQCFDDAEREALVEVGLRKPLQLTAGRLHAEFEKKLAERFGVKHAIAVNSGSSANLVALAALGLPVGSRVVTVACAFPTTVAPIVQLGLVPVFVDVGPDGNVDPVALRDGMLTTTGNAQPPRAIVLAHALGFPFDLDKVQNLAEAWEIPLLADSCDAAGATWHGKQITSLADVSTLSFYPAHHITTGEGGAVLTSNDEIARAVRSLRDWGRDCTCPPDHDNTCGKRFEQQFGGLPFGYDHKYVYTRLGYNLRMTEMQAAIGLVQLAKLDSFIERRRETWGWYRNALQDLHERDLLDFPEPALEAEVSPFGFLVTVREGAPFTREQLVARLEARRIQTRPLFAGNLIRHPAMHGVNCEVAAPHRWLAQTDRLMQRAFWIGVYPGVTDEMRKWVAQSFHEECRP